MKITELYGKQFILSGNVNSTTYKIEKINKRKSLVTWKEGKTEYYNSDIIWYVDSKEWVLIKENPIQHDDFNEYTKEIKVNDAEIVTPEPYDFINPDHYKNSSKEVIDMMLDIWGVEKLIAHCEMCAFKYRMRIGSKPSQLIENDLQKAQWYENKAKTLRDDKTV